LSFIPNTPEEEGKILEHLGVSDFDDLLDVPRSIRLTGPLNLPESISEQELVDESREIGSRNRELICFAGAGVYDHHIPSAVKAVVSDPSFLTAYTPYQAEVSQGTLQSIYEFQSLICALTGMEVASASLYDGGSALAEGALMACAVNGKNRVAVSEAVNPLHRRVVETYLGNLYEIVTLPCRDGVTSPDAVPDLKDCAAIIMQQPNFFGCIEDLETLIDLSNKSDCLSVVSVNPISLGVLEAPGTLGADIVLGEGQCLGNPMSFGGPLLGFLASRKEYIRRMPGRIAGATTDLDGNRGFVLTLQTREQHIRREKATSNICSNQALNALAATAYLSLLGPAGIKELAELCMCKAHYAADRLESEGMELRFKSDFFNEFTVDLGDAAPEIVHAARNSGVLPGIMLDRFDESLRNCLLIAVTEKRSRAQIDRLIDLLTGGKL
jgi:glycine dehydrogenase subunit 1